MKGYMLFREERTYGHLGVQKGLCYNIKKMFQGKRNSKNLVIRRFHRVYREDVFYHMELKAKALQTDKIM